LGNRFEQADGGRVKAEYDWSLLWQMLKEDKEKAAASGTNTDGSTKENDSKQNLTQVGSEVNANL